MVPKHLLTKSTPQLTMYVVMAPCFRSIHTGWYLQQADMQMKEAQLLAGQFAREREELVARYTNQIMVRPEGCLLAGLGVIVCQGGVAKQVLLRGLVLFWAY
jgi:hypothetical protein